MMGYWGVDILQKQQSGPADILLSKGEIHLNGHKIPCIQVVMHSKVRRVLSADHYIIHGGCEQIIDVFVERRVTDYYQDKCEMVIEPGAEFRETYPLLMTATVVDINCGATQKVRILNPLNESILEDEEEVNNICCIRRIKSKNETKNSLGSNLENDPKLEFGDTSNISVPAHLEELYEEAISYCNTEEKRKIAHLLIVSQNMNMI